MGGNNRTVALRILQHELNSRIEHRLCASDANPYYAILAILIAIDYGINNKLPLKLDRVYGIAYDDHYNLVKLPNSLLEAAKQFKKSTILHDYLYNLIYSHHR